MLVFVIVLSPGVEPGAPVPQTDILSIKLREQVRNKVQARLYFGSERSSRPFNSAELKDSRATSVRFQTLSAALVNKFRNEIEKFVTVEQFPEHSSMSIFLNAALVLSIPQN